MKLLASVVLAALMLADTAHGEPKPILVMPMSFAGRDSSPTLDGPDVLLEISNEGYPIALTEPGKVMVYADKNDKTPFATFTTTDLAQMHDKTKCSRAVKGAMKDARVGTTIFCHDAIDLKKAKYWVLQRPGEQDLNVEKIRVMYRDQGTKLLHAALIFDDD